MSTLPRFNFTLPVLQVLGQASVKRISPGASALRAAIDMIKARTNALVVLQPGRSELKGIITERDFLFKLPLQKGQSRASVVDELMTPVETITTAPMRYTVQQCVSVMRNLKVRHLPVVEGTDVKALIGMEDVSQQIVNTLRYRDPSSTEPEPTVGDLIDDERIHTPHLEAALPGSASVEDAVRRMREVNVGSLLVLNETGSSQFGIFTERDYLYNVVPFDERAPSQVRLEEVSRYTSGMSKRTMQNIAMNPNIVHLKYRPESVTCVQRSTKLRDCLSLMLGNGLLYVPVTEEKKPINIISMRDINLWFAPEPVR